MLCVDPVVNGSGAVVKVASTPQSCPPLLQGTAVVSLVSDRGDEFSLFVPSKISMDEVLSVAVSGGLTSGAPVPGFAPGAFELNRNTWTVMMVPPEAWSILVEICSARMPGVAGITVSVPAVGVKV